MPQFPTLLDMAKRNGRERAIPLIEETSKLIPEISGKNRGGKTIPGVGTVRTIKGINYETLVRVGNPTAQFRNANQGVQSSTSTYVNRLVQTYIMNLRWEADKAVADRSEDGPDAYMADEGLAMTESGMQMLGTQFFYGRTSTGDSKGFNGLAEIVDDLYVKDMSGTPGQCTSVYFVKFGIGDVCWVWGENGSLNIPDKRTETIYRIDEGDTVGKPLDGYVQTLLAYPGLQVGSIRSVGRLKGVSAEANKSLTDTLLFQTFQKLDMEPDVVFMNKTAQEQLRESRTTFNATGSPAPLPEDCCGGIPIAVTQSLTMTE